MDITRRNLLTLGGAASVTLFLAGCAGFSKPAATAATGTLTFTTWGTDAELAGFRTQIARFEKANPGSKIALNAVPYAQMFTNIDAQLQAGNPPDIFRVPYYTFGSYAGRGQLLDLTKHLPSGFSDRFTPAAWAAVQNKSKPFGVPHHTDTTAILYNKSMLAAAGITDVPTTLDKAWTWKQFDDVAATLRKNLPASQYPFAYNWQGNGVTRWLTWLFEQNGRFLAENLTDPAIDSAAGRKALDFTSSFFTKQYVPKNDTIKSATYAQDSWYAQTTAMVFSGGFAIPDATQTLKFDWGATFAPHGTRGASDFGGNALVATKNAKDPALAASFLSFMTEEASMRAFCESASLLPTRRDLIASGIHYTVRPELSPIFVGQASTVKASDSSQVASPNMAAIITVLKDGLDQAFQGSQSTDVTLKALSDGIAAATRVAK
jgi:multiple sugar transport system substrate-binding protein